MTCPNPYRRFTDTAGRDGDVHRGVLSTCPERISSSYICAEAALVEFLIDRVLVDNGDVEIRYVIPTTPRGETTRFYQLRKDYFEMPFISGPRLPAAQLIGIVLAELEKLF